MINQGQLEESVKDIYELDVLIYGAMKTCDGIG